MSQPNASLPLAQFACRLCGGHHVDRTLYSCGGCRQTFCARTVGALVNGYFHPVEDRRGRALCGPLSRQEITVDLELERRRA